MKVIRKAPQPLREKVDTVILGVDEFAQVFQLKPSDFRLKLHKHLEAFLDQYEAEEIHIRARRVSK